MGLFIGLILLFAQQTDTLATTPYVLHDSLATGEYHIIPMSNLAEWKFKPGDDSNWANPKLDDSDWHSGASVTADSLWTGIGWLRRTFEVDSSLEVGPRILKFDLAGAAELYVNGKLVRQIGTPSANPEEEQVPYYSKSNYPIVTFFPGEKYVVAIRYSFHSYPIYKFFASNAFPLMNIGLTIQDYESLESLYSEKKERLFFNTLLSVFFLMVMLLHLFMHIRFKNEKGNFWVFIISFLLFVLFTFFVIGDFEDFIPLILMHIIGSYGSEFVILALTLLPIAIGRLLNIKIRRLWFFLPLSTPIFSIIRQIQEEGSSTLSRASAAVLVLLILAGIIDSILQAKKLKRKDLLYIAIPFISIPILFLLPQLLRNVFGFNNDTLRSALLFLMVISVPLGMSIYQMKRFFTAHGDLENEVESRTLELEQSLNNLKSTQSQLIQSEKMASLGELTAGIAHEIQNPLNFVNNFSELNRELIVELKEELEKGDLEEVKLIATDIEANEEKINVHGKRADAIVKGMLEHSRANKGEKAPTDLNALADEFVRLSYHGLGAKDNSFNADFKLELDPTLPKVNVVASDIGRVILNLVNNAFYAVHEKAKSTPQPSRNIGTGSEGGEGYKPLVTVKTTVAKSPSGDLGVELSVKDNGNGIPEHIKEKIFQPFFTTKPTGQGTGLGLSLSYDIVKAHGGELKVVSEEGKGTEMKITLLVIKDS